ncbi:MAG: hypothetical protein M1812_005021 [Candelaria pacifica]|nr:MAG: hypothetical protein M1812_005021 [Candelaria pacifica]
MSSTVKSDLGSGTDILCELTYASPRSPNSSFGAGTGIENDVDDKYSATPPFTDFRLERHKEYELLILDNLPRRVEHWRLSFPDGLFLFSFTELDLRVEATTDSPTLSMRHEVLNRTMSRKAFDAMRECLKGIIREHITYGRGIVNQFSTANFAMLLLRLIEESASHVEAYRLSLPEGSRESEPGYNQKEVRSWEEVVSNEHGVDLDTVTDTAHHWLGKTPKQICAKKLEGYRIVHVESIMRSDLSQRFRIRQNRMREELLEKHVDRLKTFVPKDRRRDKGRSVVQKEQLVDYLITPRLTFHGTTRERIPSIVKHGFLKPGDKHPATDQVLPVRCGNTYGRGIYTSPQPAFSLQYNGVDARATNPDDIPGLKLIVCATLMGRPCQMVRNDDWHDQSRPYKGADSHVGNDEREYIVFDSAQVLPCYVLHLDWGNRNAEEFLKRELKMAQTDRRANSAHPKLSLDILSPGDKQRLKQEKIAKASKFFAYGFGPISGRNIVIEEIGEVDEDEEDYGEYQEDRLEGEQECANIWEWGKAYGETSFDVYAKARKSKAKN